MSRAKLRDRIYRGRRFEGEIIELYVRWYTTYRLSYRDLVAIMVERGLRVSHTTIPARCGVLQRVVHRIITLPGPQMGPQTSSFAKSMTRNSLIAVLN
jgi:hypothetical protein